MKCRQITTFTSNGEPHKYEKNLAVTSEKDEIKHVESGVINIYPEITYQTIEGFGGAITETSAYLFGTLSDNDRKKALEDYFGEGGNHMKFIRTSIDSCDYSLGEYQAVGDPIKDPDFTTFSLERDRKYIIPMIKEAVEMSSEPISVLLSPWSPPYQWKTPPIKPQNDASVYGKLFDAKELDYSLPQRNNGGSLKPEFYESWAKYLAKYVQAYLDEGIPVTMMTMQNESIAATDWDSCVWTSFDQKKFLKENLYPEFKKTGLDSKVGIYIWDHNKERVLEWSMNMLDTKTSEMVEGIAFHWYSGDHFEAVQMTHELFPDKKLMLSECCGLHQPGKSGFAEMFGLPAEKTPEEAEYEDGVSYAHDIIGNLNAGMNRWIDWNFCVDMTGGPRHIPGGFTAGMTIDNALARKNMIYYYVGHFSEYIMPSAVRIGFSRCDDNAEITVARNPDGTAVLVALNKRNSDAFYTIRIAGNIIRFSAPARTISTLVIEEN